MEKDIIYPKDIETLLEKLNFIMSIEQNIENLASINEWIIWYRSIDYKCEYKCDEKEFLKIYSDDNKFALQVWEHNDLVDSIKFNLLANFPSVYNVESTKVIFE